MDRKYQFKNLNSQIKPTAKIHWSERLDQKEAWLFFLWPTLVTQELEFRETEHKPSEYTQSFIICPRLG